MVEPGHDGLFVHTSSRPTLVQKSVTITHSVLEATKGAEAVVIATEWPEFKKVDWAAVYAQMSKPAFIFDGRLIVDATELRKIGFRVSYHAGYIVSSTTFANLVLKVLTIGRGESFDIL